MTMPKPGVDFDPVEHPAVREDHPLLARLDKAGGTQYGLDYAWQHVTPAQLVRLLNANQADFAARYINDPGGKGITQAEAQALQAAGIIICPVYETTGTTFRGGHPAGIADGKDAAAGMRARGAPAGSLCWFAIDTDTSDYTLTNNYLRGCQAGSGAYVAQLYGKNGVCDAAAQAGLGTLHWQTYAWSRGAVSAHALLYQYANGVMIGGISMDRDRTLQPMQGPWAHSGTITPPAADWTEQAIMALPTLGPSDSDSGGGTLPVHRIQALVKGIGQWNQLGPATTSLAVDGNYGTATVAGVKAIQKFFKLSQDGITGPDTWRKLIGA